jgi:hypothetical protein
MVDKGFTEKRVRDGIYDLIFVARSLPRNGFAGQSTTGPPMERCVAIGEFATLTEPLNKP